MSVLYVFIDLFAHPCMYACMHAWVCIAWHSLADVLVAILICAALIVCNSMRR